jgi:hypothetical protein
MRCTALFGARLERADSFFFVVAAPRLPHDEMVTVQRLIRHACSFVSERTASK